METCHTYQKTNVRLIFQLEHCTWFYQLGTLQSRSVVFVLWEFWLPCTKASQYLEFGPGYTSFETKISSFVQSYCHPKEVLELSQFFNFKFSSPKLLQAPNLIMVISCDYNAISIHFCFLLLSNGMDYHFYNFLLLKKSLL